MRGDNIRRSVLARIRDSGLTLSVVYPPTRPAATGASPASAPLSPFTGPVPTTVVVTTDPTPAKPSVSLKCLWLDTYGSVVQAVNADRIRTLNVGWMEGATALARVAVDDAALDPTKPLGDTVFTGAERVEFSGSRFRVLNVQPVGASFYAPYTYYVWLIGAVKQ